MSLLTGRYIGEERLAELAGARPAMPHGRPSEASIERGNVLLIDFGCIVDGYRSDMTRTM
ncbi:MAG: M24 family metallopeptidase, partial [Vicinamibacteria bacterium]